MNTQPIKLWSDYYSVSKPRCLNCIQQGITENEYKFCSTEKNPSPVYDEWGKKLIHTFNNIYACNVYHWTIYQGEPYKVEQRTSN